MNEPYGVMRAKVRVTARELPSDPEEAAVAALGSVPEGWEVDGVMADDWALMVTQKGYREWSTTATVKLLRKDDE